MSKRIEKCTLCDGPATIVIPSTAKHYRWDYRLKTQTVLPVHCGFVVGGALICATCEKAFKRTTFRKLPLAQSNPKLARYEKSIRDGKIPAPYVATFIPAVKETAEV